MAVKNDDGHFRQWVAHPDNEVFEIVKRGIQWAAELAIVTEYKKSPGRANARSQVEPQIDES